MLNECYTCRSLYIYLRLIKVILSQKFQSCATKNPGKHNFSNLISQQHNNKKPKRKWNILYSDTGHQKDLLYLHWNSIVVKVASERFLSQSLHELVGETLKHPTRAGFCREKYLLEKQQNLKDFISQIIIIRWKTASDLLPLTLVVWFSTCSCPENVAKQWNSPLYLDL